MTSTTTSTHPFSAASAPAPAAIQHTHPVQRKTMSITQTYYLAHKARAKLSSQAARPDHDLRLLVGHANLLDTLMLELADAEREQESWFNQSVRVASPAPSAAPSASKDRHVQWADAIVEEDESEEDWEADDSDVSSDVSSEYSEDDDDEEAEEDASDERASPETVYADEAEVEEDDDVAVEEFDEDDCDMADAAPLRRVASHNGSIYAPTPMSPATMTVQVLEAEDSESEAEADDEDYAALSLTRSPSHHNHHSNNINNNNSNTLTASLPSPLPSPTSPPELVMEDSDVSEDESLPPSPPTVALQTFDKSAEQHLPAKYDDSDRLYLPPRNPARLVSAVSVY